MEHVWDVINDPITLGSFYAAAILLVMLYALALVTRRVRILQSHLEAMQTDLRLINDEIKELSNSHQTRAPKRESVESVLLPGPPPASMDHGESGLLRRPPRP
ncbi:MAG: hypothetical protein EXR72_17680 [Myxococcales bacterium]|nr:hypothetical protein [Myxococcales bacterium]